MKNQIIIILFFNYFHCKANLNAYKDDSLTLKAKVEQFISMTTSENIYTSQFKVYVMKVFKNKKNEIYYNLSYIINSDDSKYIIPSHYFKLNNDFIIVQFTSDTDTTSLNEFELKKFNAYHLDAVKIIQKLFPSALGGYNYQPSAILIYKSKNKFISEFYENAEEIRDK